MRDAEKLIAWVREAAYELENAHALLDASMIPRSVPGSENECSLAGRIQLALEAAPESPADRSAVVAPS